MLSKVRFEVVNVEFYTHTFALVNAVKLAYYFTDIYGYKISDCK